jgi:hypothetical protein
MRWRRHGIISTTLDFIKDMEKSLAVTSTGIGRNMRSGLFVLVFLIVVVGLVLAFHNWDATAFIMMGERFKDLNYAGDLGYDGQFVYYIASDPLNAPVHIDHAAYRYQRILYPFLAWLFSLGGNPALLHWAMLGINLLAAAIACSLLGELLEHHGGQTWHLVAFMFSAGMIIALRADLNEPLAILLALVGLVLAYREKWSWAGTAFALAILAKEIALAFPLGVVGWLLVNRRFRIGVTVLAISLLPALIWGGFLTLWLGQSPLSAEQAASELLPFYGLRFIGVSPLKVIIVVWVALPALLFGALGLVDLWKRKITLETMIMLANVGLIAFMPRLAWINVAGALRATIGLTAISLIYVAARRPRLVPWLGAFWIMPGLILLPVMIIGPYVN